MQGESGNFNDASLIACMSCLAPNDEFADFCEKCGTPLSTSSTLDPLKIIRTEGFIVGKATTIKRPKFIIVLGIWVLLFPSLVVSLFGAVSVAMYGAEFAGFFLFWVAVGWSVFVSVVLYRVTRNYMGPISDEDAGEF